MSMKENTINSKHLRNGDPLPPYTGTVRLYNTRYCPYAQRAVLVLNAKNIDYEVVNINLADKPNWFISKSPLGKVPALEIEDGVSVFESLVTAEYLDEVYPQRRLQAEDPLTRARDKIIIEVATTVSTVMFTAIYSPEDVNEELIQKLHTALDFIQAELENRGIKFLGGSQPGHVDYMIWPWFERLSLSMTGDKVWPLPEKFSELSQYISEMRKDPAVSQYLIHEETFVKFFESFKAGTPAFDLLELQ